MKTSAKLTIAMAFLSLSSTLSAQLLGAFPACDAGPTFYPWYIGGNTLMQLAPVNAPPHWTPLPMDLGTCDYNPFILKSNNLQSVFIMPSGYIGINNNSPSAALDIKSPSTGSSFRIYGDASGNLESASHIRFQFATGKDVLFNEGTVASNTTRMTIRHGGQVSIGNPLKATSPYVNTALLSVDGQIISQEVIVKLGEWADFVFDKDYKLMSLTELENFYKNNHHLPNVPAKQEIEDKGDDLGKTDAILLQKIEELTLYIVDLEKRLKQVEGK